MKKIIFVVFLLLLAFPVIADKPIINAQDSTLCNDLGYCETQINLTKYFGTSEIAVVKTIDIMSRLPTPTNDLKSINYRIENNSFLIIYGAIKNEIGTSVYWTLDLNYAIIDPYWNYTYNGTWTLGGSAGCSASDLFGIQIQTNSSFLESCNLTSLGKASSLSLTACQVWNQTATITNLGNGTFTGDWCDLDPPIDLQPNEYYFLTTSGSTSRLIATTGTPISTGYNYSVIGGVFHDGSWHNDLKPSIANQEFNLYNITISCEYEESVPEGSYTICTEEGYLFINTSRVHNGVLNNTQEYIVCNYGCDNVTISCYPPPFVVDIISVIIISMFFIFIAWLLKRRKK